MWQCHTLDPSAVTASQLGWKQGAGVVWHPAFLSGALGVCSWTMSQLSWPRWDKHSLSIMSQLKR